LPNYIWFNPQWSLKNTLVPMSGVQLLKFRGSQLKSIKANIWFCSIFQTYLHITINFTFKKSVFFKMSHKHVALLTILASYFDIIFLILEISILIWICFYKRDCYVRSATQKSKRELNFESMTHTKSADVVVTIKSYFDIIFLILEISLRNFAWLYYISSHINQNSFWKPDTSLL
jgi:hypothetical protein